MTVMVEACGESYGRYRWHLTDADEVSVRVLPAPYASPEEAVSASQAALDAFRAATQV